MTERVDIRIARTRPAGASAAPCGAATGSRWPGTAPIWPDGSCDPDPGVQARRCLEIIEQALAELGAGLEHVVRTRMFITDRAHQDAVGEAHGAVFGDHRPVATMVVCDLLDPRWKVEIEAEAWRQPARHAIRPHANYPPLAGSTDGQRRPLHPAGRSTASPRRRTPTASPTGP